MSASNLVENYAKVRLDTGSSTLCCGPSTRSGNLVFGRQSGKVCAVIGHVILGDVVSVSRSMNACSGKSPGYFSCCS